MGIAHSLITRGAVADSVSYVGQPWPMSGIHWPPGVSLALAPWLALGVDSTLAVRALGLIAGLWLVLAGAAVITRSSGSRLVAGLWLATSPVVLASTASAGADALFAAISATTLWFAFGALSRPQPRTLLFLGLFAGLSLWLRWSGVVLLGVAALTALLSRERRAPLWVFSAALPLVLPLLLWRWSVGDGPRAPAAAMIEVGTGHFIGSALALASVTLSGIALLLLAQPRRTVPSDPRWLAVNAVWAMGVPAMHIASSLRWSLDAAGSRVWLPVLPSLGVLAWAAFASRRLQWGGTLRRGVAMIALVGALFFAWQGLTQRSLRTLAPLDPLGPAEQMAQRSALLYTLSEDSYIFTADPLAASLRSDLRWRRLQWAPNGPPVPVADALRAHPEHAEGWLLWRGEVPALGGARLATPKCEGKSCLARLLPLEP